MAEPAGGGERIRFVPDDRGGVTIVVDGQPQSHVDPADPGLLAFDYVAHLALVIQTLRPGPLRVTHIGGAGMTLARWVEWSRPGSPQIVFEPDVELTERVRRRLPLPRGHRIRVRPLDGAAGLRGLASASADVVVLDAYAAGRVPASLVSPSALAEVARVLAPDGVFVANLADEPGLAWVASFLATLAAGRDYLDTAILGSPEILKHRRFGNLVVAAGRAGLDETGLRRRVASAAMPTGIRVGAEVTRLIAGAHPFTDADAPSSPQPPAAGSWRKR